MKKHGKTSVRLRKTSVRIQYTYYQNTHILQNPHKHTHYKTHTYTHTLQNNMKPPQHKLKQNAYRKNNTIGRKKSTWFLMLLIYRYNTPFLTGPSLHFTALHLTSLHFTSLHQP
jgi:hypothetical protein